MRIIGLWCMCTIVWLALSTKETNGGLFKKVNFAEHFGTWYFQRSNVVSEERTPAYRIISGNSHRFFVSNNIARQCTNVTLELEETTGYYNSTVYNLYHAGTTPKCYHGVLKMREFHADYELYQLNKYTVPCDTNSATQEVFNVLTKEMNPTNDTKARIDWSISWHVLGPLNPISQPTTGCGTPANQG